MGAASSKAHGVCMVVGWVGFSSCGQLIAKHYRGAFPKKKVAGKDFWFAAHFACMALTVLLTIAAFIIMYVRKGGEQSTNTHSVLGLIVGILCFMQPVMAFVRPAPETKNRFWFNWAHWLVGNSAHALAIVNLYLAGNFRTVKEKEGFWWILTFYAVCYFLVDHGITKIRKESRITPSDVEMTNGAAKEEAEAPKMARKLAKNATKIKKYVLFGAAFIFLMSAFLISLIVANVGKFGEDK